MKDVKIHGEPPPGDQPMVKNLTIAASALTSLSIVVSLILQVANHLNKRPMEPGQRDRLSNAGMTLSVVRQLPDLVRQVRLFISQVRPT